MIVGKFFGELSWWRKKLFLLTPKCYRKWLANYWRILHYKGIPLFQSTSIVEEGQKK